ncbi:uncharacterized protein [Leptinotarsa decemlineata]|uniref:uncharacterized protein n=1 Tax=Leptinotarsa decemlineata TaxID=7539 RepID=UPI003D3093CA
MSLIGAIEQFNPRETDVRSYFERLEQLYICNVVDDGMIVPLLLIGGEAYNGLKDLVEPNLPSSKSFNELKAALVTHYSPKKLVISERYKFYNAVQEPNEDIKSFVAKLKNLSRDCNFGQFLNECLRDRLVCGAKSVALKRKLLSEDTLTFQQAYDTALSMELAEGQVKSMGAESSMSCISEGLDKLSFKKKFVHKEASPGNSRLNQRKELPNSQMNQWKPCFRCTRKHDPQRCPAGNWECFRCKKVGHTSRACRNTNINVMDEENQSAEEENSLVLGFLSSLESGKMGPEKVALEVEGKTVNFEIDSGACRTVMHIEDFSKYLSNLDVHSVNYDLRVLTGQGVKIW